MFSQRRYLAKTLKRITRKNQKLRRVPIRVLITSVRHMLSAAELGLDFTPAKRQSYLVDYSRYR